jgi:hypothetical protein
MSKIKKIESELMVFLTKEDDYFVMYCPALELTGYGKTKGEAKKSFEANMRIFFEETTEKGTLDLILLNLGWTIRKKPSAMYEPPNVESELVSKFQHGLEGLRKESIAIPVST